MNDNYNNKFYESLKIPSRQQAVQQETSFNLNPAKSPSQDLQIDDKFYEIEYDAHPIPGVGKFVAKPQKIIETEKDEIRELFIQMRDISRVHRSPSSYARFFGRNSSRDNSFIFYKQAMFMVDFEDDYEGDAAFSEYFPYYQLMSYEQLRTYFTWRTSNRKGKIKNISLSYAFLYIYELIGNIGTDGPQDGIEKLMAFWRGYREFNRAIDRYVLRWLKDYFIYYEMPLPFREFIDENGLSEHYPKIGDTDDSFALFSSISKYDIRKSAFFSDNHSEMIISCFNHVVEKLREVCLEYDINFNDAVFQPTKNMSVWVPFRDALFYQHIKQVDRRIVYSANEIYICKQNKWTFSTTITTESGRLLIGYIMKRMESDLRLAVGHRHKLKVNMQLDPHPVVEKLAESKVSIEDVISKAVAEFYRELNRTVVRVDLSALSNIRSEALATQEKLIVPEHESRAAMYTKADASEVPSEVPVESKIVSAVSDSPLVSDVSGIPALPDVKAETNSAETNADETVAFTETELQAMTIALDDSTKLKAFADGCGVMLEVLVEGINDKSMDLIGDSVIDDDFGIYDDYIEQIKEWIQ